LLAKKKVFIGSATGHTRGPNILKTNGTFGGQQFGVNFINIIQAFCANIFAQKDYTAKM